MSVARRLAVLLTAPLLACLCPASPRIDWAFQTDGPIRGEAVVDDGTVFFGSSDGFLYAVDQSRGELRWKVDTGGAIAGAPAVTDDLVIVAGRGTQALAVDRESGAPRWSFSLGATLPTPTEWNYFTAAPVVDGDQVLVPSGDGVLYALDLATGVERWRFQTGDSLRASPLVADGVVYQPSCDDIVYALSAADGSEQWRFVTEGVNNDLSQGFIRSDIFTRPSLANGLLVIGSRDSNIYAIDIATHEAAWTFSYDSTWAMSTSVKDSTVYVGWSTNRMVTALDLMTGEKKWDHQVGSLTYTDGLVVGDRVHWGCADGKLYAFNTSTGALDWTYDVGSEIYSAPTCVDGTFYFGTDDGRLLAVSEAKSPAHKAFYLPETIAPNLRAFLIDESAGEFFASKGYDRLATSEALRDWIAARTTDGSRSAIVFVYPMIPDAVISEDPSSGPMRAYLEAGGKVVWPWGIPNKITFDDDGAFRAYDPSAAERLLDLKVVGFEDGGNYYARATQTGRNWGLPAHTKTSFAYLAPESTAVVTPLAFDEFGRVGAWVKAFTDRPGTGWVSYLPSGFEVPFTAAQFELLEHVASYGLD